MLTEILRYTNYDFASMLLYLDQIIVNNRVPSQYVTALIFLMGFDEEVSSPLHFLSLFLSLPGWSQRDGFSLRFLPVKGIFFLATKSMNTGQRYNRQQLNCSSETAESELACLKQGLNVSLIWSLMEIK